MTKIKHIEGLRALAALSVCVYHLKIFTPNAGFLGVDIFLVISGFLIGIQLQSAVIANTLQIFTIKRFLRIGPMFALVSLFTGLGAYFVLLPHDLKQLGNTFAHNLTFTHVLFGFIIGMLDSAIITIMVPFLNIIQPTGLLR